MSLVVDKKINCQLEDLQQIVDIEKEQKEKPYFYDADALEQEIRDINDELSLPPSCSREICSYTTKYAYPEIQEELKSLLKKGYEFVLDSNKKPFFENNNDSYKYEIKRAIKLRFKCKNNRCPQFKRDEEENHMRKWTTYYGMILFSFYFEKQDDPIYKLRYNLKIFGQKCFSCKQWGSGSILEPDLDRLSRLYSIIVEIVMHQRLTLLRNHDLEYGIQLERYEKYGKAPSLKNRNKKRKDIGMKGRVLRHREDLCQACSQGVCMYFYVPRTHSESD